MTKLSLTFACESYDRIRALQDGRVRPEGIDLNVVALPVEETFYRQARYREFDVSEMSMSSPLGRPLAGEGLRRRAGHRLRGPGPAERA